MCGYDLQAQARPKKRVSWIDALLVLAVLAVLAFWWRIASQPSQEVANGDQAQAILPTNIPLITPTEPITSSSVSVEPTATPTVATSARADGVIRHRVRPGQTLFEIASLYGVSVEDIQAANGLGNELIHADQELFIPVTQTDDSADPVTVASQFEYTVLAGDTVVTIASRFGSTIEEIQRANGLTDNAVIRPGDVLVVPVRQVPPEVLASSPEPDVAATPTVQGGPAVPPAETIYIEPRLIGPPDAANLGRTEPILLRWISVDVLDPNEWYVLLVYPISGDAQSIPSIWTKATSYRLNPELAPAGDQSATYGWQVSVVRVRPGQNNQFALEAASPPSELRQFTWQ